MIASSAGYSVAVEVNRGHAAPLGAHRRRLRRAKFAFAGLLADISAGRYAAGDNVLFIMTGGSPGLYAYASDFLGEER